MRRAGFHVIAGLLAYPGILHRMPGYVDAFLRSGIRLRLHPFRGQFRGRRYPGSYSRHVKSYLMASWNAGVPEGHPGLAGTDDLTADERALKARALRYWRGKLFPQGSPCLAGATYAQLRPDGMLRRCDHGERLGDFFSPHFSLRSGPAPCRCERCTNILELANLQEEPPSSSGSA